MLELVPLGGLDRVLESLPAEHNWPLLLCIAMDVARGMLYLHNHTPAILHRDLKSLNILVRFFIFSFSK